MQALPVSRFHGIGPVTAKKMHSLGIETGADLRAKPLGFLEAHFGSSADWYYDIARGQDDRPVNPNRIRKSSGSETTFDRDLTDPIQIEAGILDMANDVWEWCEKAQSFGRTVTVKVKFQDFQQITRSKSYIVAVETQKDLQEASLTLIRSVFPIAKGIRLVGVTVSNFSAAFKAYSDAMPLFANGQLELVNPM